MTSKRLRLALALATLSLACSPAFAADPIFGPKNQAYPPFALINPNTGQPITNFGGAASSPLAPADASGTVQTANAFQTAIAQNSGRVACTIQNPASATENLLVYDRNGGTPSANNAYTLSPGQTYSCNGPSGVVTNAIQVTAATAGHAYAGSAQ